MGRDHRFRLVPGLARLTANLAQPPAPVLASAGMGAVASAEGALDTVGTIPAT